VRNNVLRQQQVPSIKGTELLLKQTKAIIMIIHATLTAKMHMLPHKHARLTVQQILRHVKFC